MIRVVITGPPSGTGFFPYKIESWAYGRPQFVGVSHQPLLDACRQLKQAGLMDDTVVGLFDEGAYKDEWRLRTTVGYGAKHTVKENNRTGPVLAKYKPFPYDALRPRSDLNEGAGIEGAREAAPSPSGEPSAKSEAPPPAAHTPPEPLVDTGPAPASPDKRKQSRRRPRPKGLGGRRGSR